MIPGLKHPLLGQKEIDRALVLAQSHTNRDGTGVRRMPPSRILLPPPLADHRSRGGGASPRISKVFTASSLSSENRIYVRAYIRSRTSSNEQVPLILIPDRGGRVCLCCCGMLLQVVRRGFDLEKSEAGFYILLIVRARNVVSGMGLIVVEYEITREIVLAIKSNARPLHSSVVDVAAAQAPLGPFLRHLLIFT